MTTDNYTNSHKAPGKGSSYDEHYKNDPWRRFLWGREKRALQDILQRFLADREVRLLDFACGTGRLVGFLEDKVANAVGIDVAEAMLQEARAKLSRTELIAVDITQNDVLGDRQFDLITSFRFFLNAEPQLRLAVLEVLVRHLAKDGYLVFNNHRNSTAPLVRHKYADAKKPRNFMSTPEMHELVRQFGLEIIKIYPIGYFPLHKKKTPKAFNTAIDAVARHLPFLEKHSESPIAVCRFTRTES